MLRIAPLLLHKNGPSRNESETGRLLLRYPFHHFLFGSTLRIEPSFS